MSFLETYLKAVLHAYPLLKTVEQDYADHIKNKSLLSYDSNKTTEELAEYLAEEILRKERLVWLKKVVENVCRQLTKEERSLIEIRYFGRKRKTERFTSERAYFRKQNKAGERAACLLQAAGLDEDTYKKYFSQLEIFQRVEKCMKKSEKRKAESQDSYNSSVS